MSSKRTFGRVTGGGLITATSCGGNFTQQAVGCSRLGWYKNEWGSRYQSPHC
ncbi:hypothetical protein P692DRAFT_2036194 [Suillus brevipes Sb2]|nr:hypothetical protein P692DRAFT_2036194 [Suillus brevipes Sb2]